MNNEREQYNTTINLIDKLYCKIDKVCDPDDDEYNAEAKEWQAEIDKLYDIVDKYTRKLERKKGRLWWLDEDWDE